MRFDSSKLKKSTYFDIAHKTDLLSHELQLQGKLIRLDFNEYLRLESMTTLCGCILAGNFVILKKVYEYAHVTNQEIYDSSFTMVSNYKTTFPNLSIYFDMVYVIGEKAKNDISIACYILWLHDLEIGTPNVPKNFQEYLSKLTDPANQEALAKSSEAVKFQQLINEKYELLYKKNDRGLDLFTFNDGESVLRSTQFGRYLERRYEELAQYVETLVNHPVDKESVFDELLKCYSNGKYSIAKVVSAGLNAVSDLKDFRLGGSSDEHPVTGSDIKELVKGWMCGFVIQEMQKFHNEHHESISKLYLARKILPAPERVYNDVSYLYERLLLLRRGYELVDEQYRNFSWEYVIKGSDAQQKQDTIDELRSALEVCQKKLKTANESLYLYREKIAEQQKKKITSNDSSDWGRLERKYVTMLEERDDEIARLQLELSSRERYIDIISAPVSENEENITINADVLYSVKYLFVGVIREEYTELKRKFPNSIFMETAQYNLTNIKVDMIVYLIPSMSHALYYKVQNTNSLKNVKKVYCNKRNMNNVLLNIYTALMNE